MKGSQHRDRGDGGAGQLGSDVLGDGGQAQNIDLQHLAGAPRRFEILAGVISQPEVQALPGLDCLTTSAWRSSWFRMAVRMKSVRFE
jgi:hypothetical protein